MFGLVCLFNVAACVLSFYLCVTIQYMKCTEVLDLCCQYWVVWGGGWAGVVGSQPLKHLCSSPYKIEMFAHEIIWI